MLCALAVSTSTSFAEVYSGNCGDDLFWSLDTETGVLDITGSGALTTYWGWREYSSLITTVNLPEGLTSLCRYALSELPNVKFFTLPSTLTTIGEGAFQSCSSLTSISIPASVTLIGKKIDDDNSLHNPFEYCPNLTEIDVDVNNPNYVSVDGVLYDKHQTSLLAYPAGKDGASFVVPNTVATICEAAFTNCYNLESVTLQEGLDEIEGFAFDGCINLSAISIPNSVTTIGRMAFDLCDKFKTVHIGKGLVSLGEWAFRNYNIESIDVDLENAKFCSIDGILFSKDTTVIYQYPAAKAGVTYSIPESVTTIENHAFFQSKYLKEILLSNSVTSIVSSAFWSCEKLEKINIPESITEIADNVFLGCRSIKYLYLHKNIASIGWRAFEGCSGLQYIMCDATTPPTCIGSFSGVDKSIPLMIPSESEDAYVNAAEWSEFTNMMGMTESTIASGSCGENLSWMLMRDGLLEISGYGEMDDSMNWNPLSSLIHSVSLPAGLTAIQSELLSVGSDIASISVDKANTVYCDVDGVLFSKDMSTLICYPQGKKDSSYTVPAMVTSIAGNAFSYASVKEVVISEGVTAIGAYAFSYCRQLSVISLPSSLLTIGSAAFRNCVSLTSVTIPNKVSNIESRTFASCYALTDILIPNSVTSIGGGAFTGNSGLISIEIPVSVTSIAEMVFADCYNMTSIHVDPENPAYCDIDGVLFNKDTTTLITYPEGKRGAYTIPNGVINIHADAFIGCKGLTSITIPNSVMRIEDVAFDECAQIETIICEATTPPVCDRWSFHHLNESLGLYVPAGSVGDYKVAEGWKYFTNINIIPGTGATEGQCGENLYWSYDKQTDILTITGTGAMYDYEWGTAPWFHFRTMITGINFPDGITTIGSHAFAGCYVALASATIPNSVIRIGKKAFVKCEEMTSVIIGNSVTIIEEGAFAKCGVLESVIMGNSVVELGQHAFEECVGLKSFNLSSTLKTISDDALLSCGFTELTIPSSVDSIGKQGLGYCEELRSILCEAVLPPRCGENAFYEVNKTIPVYVPSESVEAYKAAKEWKDFSNIKPIKAEVVEDIVEPAAEPTTTTVVVEWPEVPAAEEYIIELQKDGVTVYEVHFNSEGELLSVIRYKNARNSNQGAQARFATQTATGWQYIIPGLDPNTKYTYIVKAKNSADEVIYNEETTFTTKNTPTGIDAVLGAESLDGTVMYNGQLYIIRDGKAYTITGTKVN